MSCEKTTPWGYPLWKHMLEEHGLSLVETELQEIVRLAEPLVEHELREKIRSLELAGESVAKMAVRLRDERDDEADKKVTAEELVTAASEDVASLRAELEQAKERIAHMEQIAERRCDEILARVQERDAAIELLRQVRSSIYAGSLVAHPDAEAYVADMVKSVNSALKEGEK